MAIADYQNRPPEALPVDLRDIVAELIVEVDALRADLRTHLRDPQSHPRRPFGVPAEDLDALVQRAEDGTRHRLPMLSLRDAKEGFGPQVVDAAILARRVWRTRPGAGAVYLTTERPRAGGIDIDGYLHETVERLSASGELLSVPRIYATYDECRRTFNRNAVGQAIEDARQKGTVVIGRMQTGTPGRPPRVVALAGQPLPTHVDGHPVKWET